MHLKNSVSLQCLFFLLFPSHAHMLAGRTHQLHRCRERLAVVFGACWKRSTSRNRLSAKQSWQLVYQQLSYRSLCWATFTTITSTGGCLSARVQWLWDRIKQVHERTLLYCTCSHTHTYICKHEPTPCIPTLECVDVTAASRLSKHHKATASSDSAASESERACIYINLPPGRSF